jgi:acyl carrier protein phosphodiesterase
VKEIVITGLEGAKKTFKAMVTMHGSVDVSDTPKSIEVFYANSITFCTTERIFTEIRLEVYFYHFKRNFWRHPVKENN